MRLKKIFIENYKNLKDFNIKFQNDSFIDLLIGKNGTGKSNLFEAIIEIFSFLIEKREIGFNFEIEYSLNEEVKISYKNNQLKLDDKDVTSIPASKLPETLLVYYSGHNTRISSYIDEYEKRYVGSTGGNLRNRDRKLRKVFGIKNYHKQILLYLMLILDDDLSAKRTILEKLQIRSEISISKIVLKAPHYFGSKKIDSWDATNLKYLSKEDEEKGKTNQNSFWGLDGNLRDFILKLNEGNQADSRFGREGFDQVNQHYYLTLNPRILRSYIESNSLLSLFQCFEDLTLLGMIYSLNFKITSINGDEIKFSDFSDGEVQTIFFTSIIELFKDTECILLLDEPDAFLHPEWQLNLVKNLIEATDQGRNKNQILLNTHNASTLVSSDDRMVNLFNIEDNLVRCLEVSKSYALNQLTSGLIALNEEKQTLYILNQIRLGDKPVIFTEGRSDSITIEKAWHKLFNAPMPFVTIQAFCCEYLSRLLLDKNIHNECQEKIIFGLFDFDEAYNYWNKIKSKGGADEVTDIDKGLCVKLKDKNVYAFLLAVPQNPAIRDLVVNSDTGEHFKHESRLSLELLFYGIPTTEQHFEEERIPGGGSKIKFIGNKVNFAKSVVPNLPVEAFEIFRPMFEFIRSKI
jgi:predicted ATP-binding protein involved in virulence